MTTKTITDQARLAELKAKIDTGQPLAPDEQADYDRIAAGSLAGVGKPAMEPPPIPVNPPTPTSAGPSMADIGSPAQSTSPNPPNPPNPSTKPTGASGPVTPEDVAKHTDPKTGKTDWAKLFLRLGLLGAGAVVGGALGGVRGAGGATGVISKGFEEQDKNALEEQAQKAKQKLSDLALVGKAPETITTHDPEGNEVVKQWDPAKREWVVINTGRKPVTPPKPEKPPAPTRGSTIQRDVGGTPHNILIDPTTGKDIQDMGPVGQKPEKPPKEPAEKPPTTQEIAANLRNLTTEEEEIRGNREKGILGRGTFQKDAGGNRIPNATKVFEPDDQDRLDQIREEKKYWRDLQSGLAKNKVLGKLAGAGKGKGATPELSPDDTKKYQDGIKAYRTNGWTDGEIHMKLRGAGLTDEQIKGLGIQ